MPRAYSSAYSLRRSLPVCCAGRLTRDCLQKHCSATVNANRSCSLEYFRDDERMLTKVLKSAPLKTLTFVPLRTYNKTANGKVVVVLAVELLAVSTFPMLSDETKER